MRFKKLVSGLLACAMVVTSVFTGDMAVAKAAEPEAKANVISPDDPLAAYGFDGALGTGVTAIQKGLGAYTGNVEYVAGRSGEDTDKALKTGSHGVKLDHTNLGSAYTLSAWLKPDGIIEGNAAVIFVGYHNPEKWVGIAGQDSTQKCKIWTNDKSGSANYSYKTVHSVNFPKNQWTMVTLSQEGENLDIYVNGNLVKSDTAVPAMKGANQSIWLATNNWDSSFKGAIDDVKVYNKKLTADQVKAVYVKDATLQMMNALGENAGVDYITTDLNLPESFQDIPLTWESKDSTKITSAGKVLAQDGSKVALTATSPSLPEWSKDFTVTLAKEVTINYVKKGETAPLKSAKKIYKAADSYTYELADSDNVWTDSVTKKTYVYSAEGSTLTTDNDTATITLAYTEDAITAVTGKIPALTTRIGVRPNLPKTVAATFESGETRQVEIDWSNLKESDYAAATGSTPRKITAIVGTKTQDVDLTVKDKADYLIADYTFDAGSDGLTDALDSEKFATKKGTDLSKVEVKEGLQGNAVYFSGEAHGEAYLELPDNLLKAGESETDAKDITISLFVKRNIGSNSFAMSLLTSGEENTSSGDKDYIGLINHGQCRAEIRQGQKEIGRAEAVPTKMDEWNHFAIVINSTEHTMQFFLNGKPVGDKMSNQKFDISTFRTPYKNYLGHTIWPDPDYKGAIDEFKIYDAVLTEGEIKSICDDTLYTTQVDKTWNGLKAPQTLAGQALEVTVDETTKTVSASNVVEDLELPVTGAGASSAITWDSDNEDVIDVSVAGEGRVTQPSGADAPAETEVTLTATIKIGEYDNTSQVVYKIKVPKIEGVNTKPLATAISDAQKALDAATAEGIYTAASRKELEDAIMAAKEALESADITSDKVKEEVDKLKAAVEKGFALKDLEELKDVMTAWYPLNANTKFKDMSGRNADAEAAQSVEFTNVYGATLNGGKALNNMIKLPVDRMRVTDKMTFSFRVNAKQARNLFGIGTVVGSNGGGSKMLFLTSAFNALVTDNGWAGGAAKGYENLDFALNTWHNVTVVVAGKTITLYLDGEKKETKETDTTLPAAWNYEEGTKFAYLGNCAYAHNGDGALDPDFDGSIKDVRIYNAALADEQIEAIDAYRLTLPMEYAKEELIEAMGARTQEDGTHTLNITQRKLDADNKLTLPEKLYGDQATVAWKSNNSEIINAETRVVNLPQTKTEVTLTATITWEDKTESVEFVCSVYQRNNTLDETEDMKALQALIAKADKYTQTDYTKASWTTLKAALGAAIEEEANPGDATTLKDKLDALKAADDGLVNIASLRNKIADLRAEMQDLDANLYSEASWTALEKKLDDAAAVLAKEDATKAEVDAAAESLPAKAADGLKACGDKDVLNKAIAEAEALEAYKDAYTNWATLEAAVATAKAELAKRLEDYAPAAAALKNAINALTVKDEQKLTGTVKENLDKKLADAKAENLTSGNYTEATWKAYQDAMETLETVLGRANATKAEAEAAAAAMEAARAALAPISSQKVNPADKTKLEDAIAGAVAAGSDYTADSWTKYQAAKDALAKLSERLKDEKNNVTKDEITKAIAALDAAAAQLVPSEDQALKDQDKEELASAIADAKALKLDNYSTESQKAYKDALDALEALSKKSNATKNEVKAATEALAKAKAALVPVAEQIPTEEKKQEFTTAFEEAAKEMEGMKPEAYTEESWNRYQKAMAAMEDISKRLAESNNNVTKDEIDAAMTELNEAKAALVSVSVVDKTALDKAIADYGKLKASAYTAKTWKPFKTALDAAKVVSANADATQEEVDDALKTLNAKKKALKKIVKVTKVTLSAASKNIAIGKKVAVKPTIKPSNATDKSVTWKTSNKKWATVKNGVVTMKKAGAGKTVTITATAKDGSKKKATIKIKIMKNAVTKVSFKVKTKSVKNGKKVTLKPTVKTNGKKVNKTLAWKSSNTKWATVNAKGVVTTKKAGKGKTVTITATSTDGTNKKASVKVKITK